MTTDSYIEYTRGFFRRWVPVYDLFALPILPVYRAAARRLPCGPGSSVIDVCAGTGEMTARFARSGASVTAVDVTPEMLERARRKTRGLPVSYHVMDARRLEFADKSFDYAMISLALHDMPRKVRFQVLEETVRVTRQRIVILDYDFTRLRPLRRWLIAGVNLFESPYFRPFAREGGLDHLLGEAGLSDRVTDSMRVPVFATHAIDLAKTDATAQAPGKPEVVGQGAAPRDTDTGN